MSTSITVLGLAIWRARSTIYKIPVLTMNKNTIRREISLSGIGVHTGKHVDLKLIPSSSGKIKFRRTDLENREFLIDPKRIEVKNCSSLVVGDQRIQTLEHLTATLFAFDIDSLIIELNGDEIPIFDGSAMLLAQALHETGLKPLSETKKALSILQSFILRENSSSISVSPDSGFRISYAIEFDHPSIRKQEFSIAVNKENFVKEIASARTFGFLKDVPSLRAQGLARGGSLDNAIVLDEKDIINGPLRYSDEFVRHKILDFIGDLSLVGAPLIGHFSACRAGHHLHLRAVHFILENPDYWTFL